jgi:hypothetical protein
MKRDIFSLTMDSSSDNAITEQETFLLRTTVNGKVQDLCVLVSRNLHNLVLLYISSWPLCCLFFDIQILIAPLVSSNSSCWITTWRFLNFRSICFRLLSFIAIKLLWALVDMGFLDADRVTRTPLKTGGERRCSEGWAVPASLVTSAPAPLQIMRSPGSTRKQQKCTWRLKIPCQPELTEHLRSPPVFSGVRVTRSLVLYVCFIDRCLYFSSLPLRCLFQHQHHYRSWEVQGPPGNNKNVLGV